ncbi:elongin-B-like [Peromyscus leucopus]|uniref:elongin-B-like n=1 Tax=Peromyscus leucopus TaxID=10041 RepID=UPI001884F0E8|nr:elongin-B-like [Peromyscus leucopus]
MHCLHISLEITGVVFEERMSPFFPGSLQLFTGFPCKAFRESTRAGSATWDSQPSEKMFLMIRRHKTTIFTEAKETSTVFQLKRVVQGILQRPPEEQRLYKDDQLLDDRKTLGECGFTSQTAWIHAPATVGLAFGAENAFEALHIEPFSIPLELPDVMKP